MITDRNLIDEDIIESNRPVLPDKKGSVKTSIKEVNNTLDESIAVDISKASPTKTVDISESMPRDMSLSVSKNEKSPEKKKMLK